MNVIRRNRYPVGLFLAVLFMASAGMPGLLAAAQGVHLQAPICSPDGIKAPANEGPALLADDHCQICPLGNLKSSAPPRAGATVDQRKGPFLRLFAPKSTDRVIDRGELLPRKGRAPPSRS